MSNSCCHKPDTENKAKKTPDLIFWGSLVAIVAAYTYYLFTPATAHAISSLTMFTTAVFELINKMWWGVFLGIIFVGLLSKIPKEFVMKILGNNNKLNGILRAAAAGVLLDLCSHGILMVGMKLYERGANIGQVMAFLIASPWNSISLTIILFALIGFKWTMLFILLSLVIAIISGVIFNKLVAKKILPENSNKVTLPKEFHFFSEAKTRLKATEFNLNFFASLLKSGLMDSKMVLKWLLFGVVLAALIRTFVSPENFAHYFGASAGGLLLTMLAATVIEVCSEGSTPIAADLLTRASAPGNSFAFLMTGVSTDYTEIMSLKETTKSWKIAFFLPLVTVPQVLVISYIIN